MSEKKISYLNRDFEDYKNALKEYIKEYYPSIAKDFDDASIGSWLIDIVAAVGDNLSYHIDRVFNETNIDSAAELGSVYALARSNGLKIPGPKGSMTQLDFTCELPRYTSDTPGTKRNDANMEYAPIIKRGTKVSAGSQVFELLDDVDFGQQFNKDGYSDRTIYPITDANGQVLRYKVMKSVIGIAGETKIYKQLITANDVKPFMEIIIPTLGVMNIESIIFKDGVNYTDTPKLNDFYFNEEKKEINGAETYRFFEVESLTDLYRWGDRESDLAQAYTFGYYDNEEGITIPTASITRGEWKPVMQKFMTEYTDNGYMKVIFGSGRQVGQDADITASSDFTKGQISRMVRNDFTGMLPKADTTMYILYRVGGGAASNVAAGAVNSIPFINVDIASGDRSEYETKVISEVKKSIKVTNPIPSVSGKDMPDVEEIKAMIKYRNAAQNRCITPKDYEYMISTMPPRYGCPFRVSATEENNKIMLYMLGIDNKKFLTDSFPSLLKYNIQDYLSMYRAVNDFVEIKSGRVINLSFDISLYVDKEYSSQDVIKNVCTLVRDYMDINKHKLGEDIYVGDLEKEITKTDGVLGISSVRVYNNYGSDYSTSVTTMLTIPEEGGTVGDRVEIDLEACDYILNADSDSMFEIKYPGKDIRVYAKLR